MNLSDFYDEYVGKVYKFFYIKCYDKMTAEDLTSQTFTLFISQQEVRNIDDNKKYLYGIMRNVWIQFLRERYDAAIDTLSDVEDFEAYTDTQVSDFDSADSVAKRLEPYIARLPEKQQLVLNLRIFGNKSVGEVAEELGKDKNYVKTTHQRALKRLREMLREPYMEEAL